MAPSPMPVPHKSFNKSSINFLLWKTAAPHQRTQQAFACNLNITCSTQTFLTGHVSPPHGHTHKHLCHYSCFIASVMPKCPCIIWKCPPLIYISIMSDFIGSTVRGLRREYTLPPRSLYFDTYPHRHLHAHRDKHMYKATGAAQHQLESLLGNTPYIKVSPWATSGIIDTTKDHTAWAMGITGSDS